MNQDHHGREHESDATGYEQVSTTISCLLTRFRLRSPWSLWHFYRAFRRVRKEARNVQGLLKTVFLIENAHTCYTLSFWKNAGAIYDFNIKVNSHIRAANSAFQHLQFASSGVQLWSAQFRLTAVSPHNLRWDSFDLQSHLDLSPRSAKARAHVA
jgi:hypothetical protein